MYEQHDKDTSWSFAIGLFLGAVAGAAAASLFTPRSGQQNREAVIERGLVLKDRVSDVTHNAVSSVKDTTSSAVSSVKDTTSSAVATVKDATSTATSKVSDTVATVKDAASTAAEKVQDVASTAASKVSETVSATAEKVQDVATTTADKARALTDRSSDATVETDVDIPARTLASEASYDSEDGRPAVTQPTTTRSASDFTAQPTTPSTTTTVSTSDVATGSALDPIDQALLVEAEAELASDEQFEITDQGASAANERGAESRAAGTGGTPVSDEGNRGSL